jgi:hypothetical protein
MFVDNILTEVRCCDNGGEFRGALKALCKKLKIRMVRGRLYYLQSQGSIEVANRTFKNRLRAAQQASGRSDWVELLPEVASVINTTTSRALPHGKTPYEVWFGCKPYWIGQLLLLDSDEAEESDATESSDDDDDIVLSAIEAQVAQNNLRVYEQMKKKRGQTTKIFEVGDIATLFIPAKLQLRTESIRIAVRVIGTNRGYTLLTKHALLSGRYQGGELNTVDESVAQLLGEEIPFEPWEIDGKKVVKTLKEVVEIDNGRPSIRALQQGRKRAEKRTVTQALNLEDADNDGNSSEVQIVETLLPRSRRIIQPRRQNPAPKVSRPATRATTRLTPVIVAPANSEPRAKRRRRA